MAPSGFRSETIGGLMSHTPGHVPEPGDTSSVDSVLSNAAEVADHRIRRGLVDLRAAAPVRTAS